MSITTKCYAPSARYLLANQPKDGQTIDHSPTERTIFGPPRSSYRPVISVPKTSELLTKIDNLKIQNSKLKCELDAWKLEARAWPRGLGKISPVLRKWLEYQEEKYGLPDAKQSVENRRYMLGLLKERGLLSDRQRRESRGF